MNKETYIKYRNELKAHGPSDSKGFIHVLLFFVIISSGIILANSNSPGSPW